MLAKNAVPLRVAYDEAAGSYTVHLADLPLEKHLAADGGLRIEWERVVSGLPSQPIVTLTFGPGAVRLNLTAELLAYLRDAAEQEPTEATA